MKKLIALAVIGSFLSFVNGKMVKVKLSDNIKCLLPVNMHPMIEGDMLRRLPSARKPMAAYTDESRLVDFSVNTSATKWASGDIDIAKSFYKSSIMNLYDEVNFIKVEVNIINKNEFAIFEFESLVKGDDVTKKAIRKYSYVQYTIQDGQALVFSFNAPIQLKEKWQPTVETIMQSIKIK